jgi:hypothetical protein
MARDPHNQQHHRGQPNQPTEHHIGSTAKELAAINETLVALAKKQSEHNQKNPNHDTWKFRLEIAAVIGVGFYTLLTGGLLIVGALQTGAGWQQIDASHDQLKTMQDTERRQLRAYVGIVPGDVDNFGDQEKQTFTFIRKNYGMTPAYNLNWTFAGQKVIKRGEPIPVPNVGHVDSQNLFTIFPTMELPFHISKTPIPKDQLTAVRQSTDGNIQFVYYGTITYDDAFGLPHYTKYCWMFTGENMTGKDAEACVGNNDSD